MAEQLEGFEIDPEVKLGFLEESLETLNSLDPLFIKLESSPTDNDTINSIFRPIHSIKGNAPFFGFLQSKVLAHELESLLALIRDRKIQANKEIVDHLLTGVDKLKSIFVRLISGGPEIQDQNRFNAIVERTKQLSSTQGKVVVSPAAIATPTASATTPQEGSVSKESVKTMRIPEERIDTFLAFVGEMIVVGEMLRHFSIRLEEKRVDPVLTNEISAINDVFQTLSNGIEKAIMSIRKVSVKSVLQKAPRIVRDVANAKGKEIEVIIEGEGVEIDKSLAELLDAPLTHMIRNAADHGVEMPEKRKSIGKSPKGKIWISCHETDKHIVLTVKDDGGGLNYEGLTKKAVSLGLVESGKELSKADVINLLFMAGVSTAQEVSDISGRGVGMDVVKKNIEGAGGVISVDSVPAEGTTFKISLPRTVTTQIMHGFVVRVQDNHYVLPLDSVQESWSVDKTELNTIRNRDVCIQRHDRVLPFVELSKILGCPSVNSDPSNELVAVTLDVNLNRFAVAVDGILGVRQLVLKKIEGLKQEEPLFLGGALLGDGSIALVVDVEKLTSSIM